MIAYLKKRHTTAAYKILCSFIAFSFLSSVILPPQVAAQLTPATVLNLPVPGTMVPVSSGFAPALMTGVTVNPDNPLRFDFIMDRGQSGLEGEALKAEYTRIIKYFMASLTVPEDELWVNLSPYEKDRMIAQGLGQTEMGRDMLAQDYLLKQLTASLMYPEEELGKKFWDRIYKIAKERFGTTEIPVNTFNKVWIVPDEALVYEQGTSAFVIKSRLAVMLESDYQAQKLDSGSSILDTRGASSIKDQASSIETEIIREVIIPEIEKEINEGKNFANLRQIYNALILAVWYKQRLKDSLLGKVYVDQNKTKGIDTQDKAINQKIYDQYIESFKKGVYNFIKEDIDPATQQTIPRKYFSGGLAWKFKQYVLGAVFSGTVFLFTAANGFSATIPTSIEDIKPIVVAKMQEQQNTTLDAVPTDLIDNAGQEDVKAITVREGVQPGLLAQSKVSQPTPAKAASPVDKNLTSSSPIEEIPPHLAEVREKILSEDEGAFLFVQEVLPVLLQMSTNRNEEEVLDIARKAIRLTNKIQHGGEKIIFHGFLSRLFEFTGNRSDRVLFKALELSDQILENLGDDFYINDVRFVFLSRDLPKLFSLSANRSDEILFESLELLIGMMREQYDFTRRFLFPFLQVGVNRSDEVILKILQLAGGFRAENGLWNLTAQHALPVLFQSYNKEVVLKALELVIMIDDEHLKNNLVLALPALFQSRANRSEEMLSIIEKLRELAAAIPNESDFGRYVLLEVLELNKDLSLENVLKQLPLSLELLNGIQQLENFFKSKPDIFSEGQVPVGVEIELFNNEAREIRLGPVVSQESLTRLTGALKDAVSSMEKSKRLLPHGYYWNMHLNLGLSQEVLDRWFSGKREFQLASESKELNNLARLIHFLVYPNNSLGRNFYNLKRLYNKQLYYIKKDITEVPGHNGVARLEIKETSLGRGVDVDYWFTVMRFLNHFLEKKNPANLDQALKQLEKIYKEEELYLSGKNLQEDTQWLNPNTPFSTKPYDEKRTMVRERLKSYMLQELTAASPVEESIDAFEQDWRAGRHDAMLSRLRNIKAEYQRKIPVDEQSQNAFFLSLDRLEIALEDLKSVNPMESREFLQERIKKIEEQIQKLKTSAGKGQAHLERIKKIQPKIEARIARLKAKLAKALAIESRVNLRTNLFLAKARELHTVMTGTERAPLPPVVTPPETVTVAPGPAERQPTVGFKDWTTRVQTWVNGGEKGSVLPDDIFIPWIDDQNRPVIGDLLLPMPKASKDITLHPVWDPQYGYVIEATYKVEVRGRETQSYARRYLIATMGGRWLKLIPQEGQRPAQGTVGHLLAGMGPVDLNVLSKEYKTSSGGAAEVFQAFISLPDGIKGIKVSFPVNHPIMNFRLDVDGSSLDSTEKTVFIYEADSKENKLVATVKVNYSDPGNPEYKIEIHLVRGKRSGGGLKARKDEGTRKREGNRLKEIAMELRISGTELGRRLKPENPIPSATYSTWANGTSSMPDWVLQEAEKLLKDKEGVGGLDSLTTPKEVMEYLVEQTEKKFPGLENPNEQIGISKTTYTRYKFHADRINEDPRIKNNVIKWADAVLGQGGGDKVWAAIVRTLRSGQKPGAELPQKTAPEPEPVAAGIIPEVKLITPPVAVKTREMLAEWLTGIKSKKAVLIKNGGAGRMFHLSPEEVMALTEADALSLEKGYGIDSAALLERIREIKKKEDEINSLPENIATVEEIGAWMRKRREDLKFSRGDVAESVGIGASQLANYEKGIFIIDGNREINPNVTPWAKALNVKPRAVTDKLEAIIHVAKPEPAPLVQEKQPERPMPVPAETVPAETAKRTEEGLDYEVAPDITVPEYVNTPESFKRFIGERMNEFYPRLRPADVAALMDLHYLIYIQLIEREALFKDPEKGAEVARSENIQKLAKALKVEPSSLLNKINEIKKAGEVGGDTPKEPKEIITPEGKEAPKELPDVLQKTRKYLIALLMMSDYSKEEIIVFLKNEDYKNYEHFTSEQVEQLDKIAFRIQQEGMNARTTAKQAENVPVIENPSVSKIREELKQRLTEVFHFTEEELRRLDTELTNLIYAPDFLSTLFHNKDASAEGLQKLFNEISRDPQKTLESAIAYLVLADPGINRFFAEAFPGYSYLKKSPASHHSEEGGEIISESEKKNIARYREILQKLGFDLSKIENPFDISRREIGQQYNNLNKDAKTELYKTGDYGWVLDGVEAKMLRRNHKPRNGGPENAASPITLERKINLIIGRIDDQFVLSDRAQDYMRKYLKAIGTQDISSDLAAETIFKAALNVLTAKDISRFSLDKINTRLEKEMERSKNPGVLFLIARKALWPGHLALQLDPGSFQYQMYFAAEGAYQSIVDAFGDRLRLELDLNKLEEESQESSSPVQELQAMSDEQPAIKGGIDLNPALLDLQIKRDGNGVPLPLPQQPIETMHIEGFLPVIINIVPISNLPLLLGLDLPVEKDPVQLTYQQLSAVFSPKDRFYGRDPQEILS